MILRRAQILRTTYPPDPLHVANANTGLVPLQVKWGQVHLLPEILQLIKVVQSCNWSWSSPEVADSHTGPTTLACEQTSSHARHVPLMVITFFDMSPWRWWLFLTCSPYWTGLGCLHCNWTMSIGSNGRTKRKKRGSSSHKTQFWEKETKVEENSHRRPYPCLWFRHLCLCHPPEIALANK